MATTGKTGPSDGGYSDDRYATDDDLNEEEKKIESLGKDKKFQEEMEKLEEIRKETEERKKKKLKQLKKREVKTKKQIREEEKTKIGGQTTKRKVFEHKRGKGIFIGGESKKYLTKMNKAFKKVHGVSAKKKKKIVEFMGLGAKMSSKITEKEVDTIFRGLKHKKFDKPSFENVFKKMKKEGVDLKGYKKDLKGIFSKGDIRKFKKALKDEENTHKHKMRPSLNRNPEAGKPGSTSHHRL